MLHGSGTTSRPKGIRATLPDQSIDDHLGGMTLLLRELFHFDLSKRVLRDRYRGARASRII